MTVQRCRLGAIFILFFVTGLSLSEHPVVVSAQSASAGQSSHRDLGDIIEALLHRNGDGKEETETPTEDTDNTRVFLFPTFGSNPALGLSGGALATVTNYWGNPLTTRLSSTLLSATVTTKKQVLIVGRSDLYAPSNSWHLAGDWRFYDYLEQTHGLGSNSRSIPSAEVDYTWYRLHQVVLRPVWNNLEFGFGYHLDTHHGIALVTDAINNRTLLKNNGIALSNTTSSGVSLNLIFDQRDHPLNPARGVFGKAAYTFYRTGLGSDRNWDSFQLEGRAYQPLSRNRRQGVALWGLAWLTPSGQPPYFDLPSVGWDTYGRTARGYRSGRFRGHDWLYAEVEYRVGLTADDLFGAVSFLNTSRLSDDATNQTQHWVPGAGIGLRIKLDKNRRSNLAIDYAWGRDGSSGLYFAVNEAF